LDGGIKNRMFQGTCTTSKTSSKKRYFKSIIDVGCKRKWKHIKHSIKTGEDRKGIQDKKMKIKKENTVVLNHLYHWISINIIDINILIKRQRHQSGF
jgi:hypothetical protein